MPHPYRRHSKLLDLCNKRPGSGAIGMVHNLWLSTRLVCVRQCAVCRSSHFSCGSSPWSCTTRSSTPTSILNPPTTEKKHRTPPFNVYDGQPHNFKNPLFGIKASPSPQLAAYTGKPAAPDRPNLGSPACSADMTESQGPCQTNLTTAVANLTLDINAAAGYDATPCQAAQGQH